MKITRNTTPDTDAISAIPMSGNIVPSSWMQLIRMPNGKQGTKPDIYAIHLLSELVYWYRNAEVRDEETGRLVEIKKRFKADYVQRSHKQIAEYFGVSTDTSKEIISRLKSMGLIETIIQKKLERIGKKPLFNVMYIRLIPEAIARLQLNGEMFSTSKDDDDEEDLSGKDATNPEWQGSPHIYRDYGCTETTKEKEEICNFPRSPLAGDCSQTSNKFDVDTNIDAKPQRENENDTSEYLKAKSAKQKAAPKPKAKPAARAKFANQVDRDDYPCTKAALYAIERHVAQSGGKHNFWVDANTSRPVIQLAHIEQVERNLTDLAEYFDTMPGTIPEIAASLMMEMYEVRGAKHKVKGKKTPVDLAFLACIGLKDPHTGCDFEGQDLCGWFANSSGT